MHVIWFGGVTVTAVAAAPPMLTVAPFTKFVPVIVITSPPAASPVFGLTPVMVGTAPTVSVPALQVTLCNPDASEPDVTVTFGL